MQSGRRLDASFADPAQAEANRANAEREEQRYKLLVGQEEVSREFYDQRAPNAKVAGWTPARATINTTK